MQGRERSQEYLSIGNLMATSVASSAYSRKITLVSFLPSKPRPSSDWIPPDFSANIDIEAILKDLLNNLCTGDNPKNSDLTR